MQALRSAGRLKFWDMQTITERGDGATDCPLEAAMVNQHHAGSHWREVLRCVGSGSGSDDYDYDDDDYDDDDDDDDDDEDDDDLDVDLDVDVDGDIDDGARKS